jgi:hypothetical protein
MKFSFPAFPGDNVLVATRIHDPIPLIHPVRLSNDSEEEFLEGGRAKEWTALLDTGSPFTVIPYRFVVGVPVESGGTTHPDVKGYDGSGAQHSWYWVKLRLLESPWMRIRAVAPKDLKRTRITLGRDVIARLVVRWHSAAPWAEQALDSRSTWVWEIDLPPAPDNETNQL